MSLFESLLKVTINTNNTVNNKFGGDKKIQLENKGEGAQVVSSPLNTKAIDLSKKQKILKVKNFRKNNKKSNKKINKLTKN